LCVGVSQFAIRKTVNSELMSLHIQA
jgi:hypothetical protein